MLIAVGVLLVVMTVVGTMLSPPRGGLWAVWFTAILLTPCWMILGAGGLTIDPRMLAAVIGLTCLVVSMGSARLRRPLLLDWLVVLLWICLNLSECLVGRFSPMTAVELGRRWLLPYLVGRVFLSSSKDIRDAARIFAPIALLMVMMIYAVQSVSGADSTEVVIASAIGLGVMILVLGFFSQAGDDAPIGAGIFSILFDYS